MEKGLIGPGVPHAVLKHLKWVRECMRDRGLCIDGGTCHHQCATRCSRMQSCVPLSGSGLDDNWNIGMPPAEPPQRRPLRVGDKVRLLSPRVEHATVFEFFDNGFSATPHYRLSGPLHYLLAEERATWERVTEEPETPLREGWKVRIIRGPRAGHEGRVLRRIDGGVYEVGIVGRGFVHEPGIALARIPEVFA